MWGDPDPDPGGTRPNVSAPSPQELSDLKDQNEQQLVLIAQLKEMLRKEQSSVSQEKVEEYVNTLNRNKAKRSFRQKREGSGASTAGITSSVGIDASKKERINLLRQQMEENKARLAERGKSQKGIEEMVTQLQAQLKDNQTLISASPLNASLVEAKNLDYNESTPQKDLYNILLTKERRITELLTKSQKLESTIMDLQENLKEKDSVIDARTKAITLMTDSLSKKGKNTLDALDETKEQMRNMQENFVTLEAEMKARQISLLSDLKIKNFEISDLQQANSQLEKDKIELEKRLSEFERPDTPTVSGSIVELDQLQTQLNKLQEENQKYLQKIEELKARISETTFEQNKCKLEEELEEAMSKLKVYDEKVMDLEENVTSSKNKASRVLAENEKLVNENSKNIAKITELENQLENTMTELKLLKVTDIDNGTKKSGEKEEIIKLRKQLEESNKNMIKMRATQKGKIKELNKKLEQFRKMNDSNALIAQLQNEISKLNEKIAELEDEKGNLQLKMVESTSSSKEDPKEQEDQIKELQDKLTNLTEELGEKTKVIDILESEVLSLKADLKQKSEEEVKVSSQVSSEISSIHFEEQIEKIELEKKKLLEELENIRKEKEDLHKEMEHLKKEKQDMATKLDNYIQENMDLIDKLEKLSAEKVSSAESIEIVEGLTKQEQLELAAYQKHISPEENPRCSDEDNMEAPAELNESVLQLSEDTVELLQKIEMFTHERKEVMQKMETLKEENNLLSLKVKEIENNRDILEETYEQLQNEKEALTNEKQALLEKLDKAHLEDSNRGMDQSVEALNTKLEELQTKCKDLVRENDDLKRTFKEFDSNIQEKHNLDDRLREIIENNASLETKLSANLEEINAYKLTIEDNKNELIHYSKLINEFTVKLVDRERSIEELKSNITDLNHVIENLQAKNDNYEAMETELQNLKAVLTDQISQADNYESEMAQSSESMQRLNNELVQMNRRILELENELELKDNEIQKVNKDINNKEEIIKNLQSEIAVKDQKFKTVSEEIKNKYLQLQKQLDNNGDSLKEQINELTNKNKEQLEKMKKIAANLKKKTQAYQQLEDQYKVEKEKWESETTEKDSSIQESQGIILSLRKELKDVEDQLKVKLEENRVIQSELVEFRRKIEVLEQNNADQQHFIQELKRKQEKLQEVSLQQEMSASLHEDIDDTLPKNIHKEKVRELELLLETNESELNHYKERVDKFEESIRKLEEEKVALENMNTELIEKLNLTSNSFKEKALLEDQLELRLAEVTANDEALSKKLQEMQNEQEELRKKNQEYEELIKKLKIKLKKAHDKVTELKTVQGTLQDLETANQELKNQVASLEANQRHIQNENESLQKRNMSDYEKIEADYQVQLEELLRVKNELTVENEKLLERLKEMEEKEQELLMELEEVKLKLTHSENAHIDKINRLTDEIEIIRSEQINTQSKNQKLKTELDENLGKVQQYQVEADRLSQELNQLSKELHSMNDSQEKILSIKQGLESELKLTREQLEHASMESDSLKRELKQSNEKHHLTLEENDVLKCEINNLKQEIQALEFAKSSLEASYESSQKIGDTKSVESVQPIVFEAFSQHSDKEAEGAVPTFHWPDQPRTPADLFDHLSQQSATELSSSKQQLNTLVLNIPENSSNSLSEIDSLKQQLGSSNEKLQSALQDAAHLRAEADQLKLEIQALQFAKASLEASYESSQKLQEEKLLDCPQAITLQNVLQKITKPYQEAPPKSSLPLFEAFSQPQSSSAFNSFDQVLQQPNQWPTEQTSVNTNLPVPSDTNMQIEKFSHSQQFSPVIEDNREALLKKIKTLEFLLYNIDKEKEIALEQCTEMVNELTQVIYNQLNPTEQATKSFPELESQILSDEAVRDLASNKTQLQKTEYTPINIEFGEQSVPVNEEAIMPQKAYICFDDDHPSKKQESLPEPINSQLVSKKDIKDCASNKKELQKLEYEKIDKSLGEQHQAVVEPLAQAKHAYLCYTKDDKPQSFDAFEENDDGWGWGPEEARLEEEHMSNVENTPQVKTLLLEIQHLKDTIRVFQVERENHLEEIKQLQIKSGKLIKKYKEIKAKADQASTSNRHDDGGFFDLNETIQEELKEQIKQLEKKVKEINTELEKEKLEKDGLVKRVDVLTAANERMMEMKEIQDSEVYRWQRKHQEVVEKLQEFEWKNDGFHQPHGKIAQEPLPSTSGPVSDSARIQELENTIRDLTLDNEELQTLLEEQNARRIEAEKNKTSANDQELSELRSLNVSLCKELDEIKLKDAELLDKVNSDQQEKNKLIKEKSELEALLLDKEEQLSKLEEKTLAVKVNNEKQIALSEFQNEILTLKKEISAYEAQLQEKDLILIDLQNNLEQLNQRKLELDQNAKQLSSELSESKSKSLALKTQIEQLSLQVNEKDKVIDDLNGFIDNFEQDKNKIGQMKEQIRMLTEEMSRKELEFKQTLDALMSTAKQSEEYKRMVVSLQEYVKEMEIFGAEKSRKAMECRQLEEELEAKSLENMRQEQQIEDLELATDKLKEKLAGYNKLTEDLQSKITEIKTITAEKVSKDVQIQQLLLELQNKEQEFEERTSILINELNEKWQVQVDQRGEDIAESWKMHLEMVEKEHNVAQEKLKRDLIEFEERCNILVNENNELRKNVDQEIRNEVDKLSALQQQISNLNQTINSLNLELQDKDKKIEELQNNLSNYMSLETELQTLRSNIIEKENKLSSINIIIETTQKQFDEKREVVEEIVAILDKNASSPISYEKQEILKEFQRQLATSSEKDAEIQQLSKKLNEVEQNLSRISGENQREITGLSQVIEDLEKELSILHEKEAEILRLTTELNNSQREQDVLQQEIAKIKHEQDNLAPEYEKLKQELLNSQTVVEDYKQKVQEYYERNLELQRALDEKTKDIKELNENILRLQEEARNDSNKEAEDLSSSVSNAKEEYVALQQTLTACQNDLYAATQQLEQKSHELEQTRQSLFYYQQHYEAFEEEIIRLKATLEQREMEYTEYIEMMKKNQSTDTQKHYDELLLNKDSDIQMLQAQNQELIKNVQDYSERLYQELAMKQRVEEELNERTQIVDEDTKQLQELKLIIEDQVVKIEELKKQLFDKSNQYDSLIAEVDVERQPVTQQPIASSPASALETAQSQKYADDDLTEPVSRAELDLALYMLHQRDVRCEELTVELTQLLEERDTLQLRLSNAIREKEELRRNITGSSPVPTTSSDRVDSSPISKSSAIFLAASGTELAKEPLESEQNLATKLSELRNMGYKKDKTFVDEQDARRLQQLVLMQQHINEASKLPPEAAARLVDASYTLSRDVQSPSKVLLNWLWGKNPPKANDS